MSECPQCETAATYKLGENSFGCKCTYEAETGAAVILHWCEVCGKEEELTSEAGYEAGWDFPPKMGKLSWVCPRTCPDCSIEKTAWFALQRGQDLSEKQEKAAERMTLERWEQE